MEIVITSAWSYASENHEKIHYTVRRPDGSMRRLWEPASSPLGQVLAQHVATKAEHVVPGLPA